MIDISSFLLSNFNEICLKKLDIVDEDSYSYDN